MPRPSSMMYRVWLEGTQEGYRGIVECTLKGLDVHQVSMTGEEGIVGKGACEVIQWCNDGNLRQEKKGRRGQGNGRKSYVHSCLSGVGRITVCYGIRLRSLVSGVRAYHHDPITFRISFSI